jgi:hypothetical protein
MPIPDCETFMLPVLRLFGEGARNINECLPKLKDVFGDKRGMVPKNERSRDVAFLPPQDTNEIGVGRRALEAEETKIGAFDDQHFVDLVLKFKEVRQCFKKANLQTVLGQAE